MHKLRLAQALLILFAPTDAMFGQSSLMPITDSTQSSLYFPELIDGGPPAQQWQTILTFNNPLASAATVTIYFYREDGQPLSLNFGSGLASQFSFAVPAGGSRIFRSRIATSTTTIGWAWAKSSVPIIGTVAFRQLVQGISKVEIAANSTLPTPQYISAANPALGVAVANPSAASLSVVCSLFDSDGNLKGQQPLSLGPNAHTQFNVSQMFPGLSTAFYGTLILTGQRYIDNFVAWTLNADAESGDLTSLPDGRVSVPISQTERILRVFQRVSLVAQTFTGFGSAPVNLHISTDPVLNAFTSADGSTIQINIAMAELVNDSESELASIIAHEFGHVYQARVGHLPYDTNKEFDADVFSALLSVPAGYDPYASAGALAKWAMVNNRIGLAAQYEDQVGADAHKSIDERAANVYAALSAGCQRAPAVCTDYKNTYHQHFPASIPLIVVGQPVQ